MNVLKSTRKFLFIASLFITIASNACASSQPATVSPTQLESIAATETTSPTLFATITEETNATPVPVETTAPEDTASELVACSPYRCAIPHFWKLGASGPEAIPLPITPPIYYDATAVTGRILYGTKHADQGAGPGQIAAGDLWWLDVRNGERQPIFPDPVVVEAALAPNGQNFAYVLATLDTYELHWHTAFGEDKLLAKDVAFTFSVSPQGDQVAFTRESRYNTAGTPGLYVVDITTGEERQVSSVDRAGYGSVTEQPVWSPDSKFILLPVSGGSNFWLIANANGSQSKQIEFSPEISGELFDYSLDNILWHPNGLDLFGIITPGMRGGPGKTVLLSLNPELDTITSLKVLRENDSVIVGWENPGEAIWLCTPEGALESTPVQ